MLLLNTTNSAFDTLLGLYTGPNVANLTTIAENDDAYDGAPGGFSEIVQAVRSNQVYYIAVDGYDGAEGAISLHYSFTPTTVYHVTTASTAGGIVQVTSTNSLGGISVLPGTDGDFASNATVVLTAVPYAFYDFSNWSGSLTSSVNPLSVVVTSNIDLTGEFQPSPFTDGFESGNLLHLGWAGGGNVPWFVQTNSAASGKYAARSGVIGNNQSSSLMLATNFAGGLGSFEYRVSSETNFDTLSFYVDGVQLRLWSGETSWAHYVFHLASGNHSLEWRYTKDSNLSAGLDAAFIDNVNLPLGVALDSSSPAHLQIVRQTNGSLTINILGQTNQRYIIQMSTDLKIWQNMATNVAAGGVIEFPVPSGTTPAQYYRAIAAPQ